MTAIGRGDNKVEGQRVRAVQMVTDTPDVRKGAEGYSFAIHGGGAVSTVRYDRETKCTLAPFMATGSHNGPTALGLSSRFLLAMHASLANLATLFATLVNIATNLYTNKSPRCIKGRWGGSSPLH